MTDEEIDEFYRPKKMNSRKTLVSLFVYLILKEHSNPEKHLTQNEIMKYLKRAPYEISIEHKSLGRTIHLLSDSLIGIYSSSGSGTWLDSEFIPDDDFFDIGA